MKLRDDTALVLFSGGQDSSTCLAWAMDKFLHVETIGFDYGQAHPAELAARQAILERLRRLAPIKDHLIKLTTMAPSTEPSDLPATFVPGRNLAFLVYAAGVAYDRGIRNLVGGMCETDYSGYPDCRDATLKAMELALNLGMDTRYHLHTPLMWLTKAQTWALAHRLGGDALVEMLVEHSHTCYRNDREHRHEWGYGCGECEACRLRAKGFNEWKLSQ